MNGYDVAADGYRTGMGRFFSPVNLNRYRKLTSKAIDDTERQNVLDALAREMEAFRRDVTRPSSPKRDSR
jgi:hypothetical protein